MTSDVWFGVHLPPEGRDFEYMKRACLNVERLGFDLFTMTDHFMNMGNPTGPGNHPLECWTVLAGLASITKRVKLGPLVSCYAYRRPTVLAKMATTVDIISGGRLIFGIGAGWHEHEFRGFIGGFPSTGRRIRGLRETVEICESMFTQEHTSYNGKLYRVQDVLNSPLPVQRPIPIMVGGGGERSTLRIAAEHAHISHFFANNQETLEHKIKILKGHCKKFGRDFSDIRKATGASVIIGRDDAEAERKLIRAAKERRIDVEAIRSRMGPAFGTLEKITCNLKGYVDKGIGLVTLSFYDAKDMRTFSEEIMPQLK